MRFLDLVSAALVIDTLTVSIIQISGRGGTYVREWYRELRIGAYAMDVLSLIIGSYIAICIMPQTLWAQLFVVVIVQLIHDLGFGAFVHSNLARGPLMDLFRRYADELGATILVVDASMLILTILTMHAISFCSVNNSAAFGAIAAYVGMLVVYSF